MLSQTIIEDHRTVLGDVSTFEGLWSRLRYEPLPGIDTDKPSEAWKLLEDQFGGLPPYTADVRVGLGKLQPGDKVTIYQLQCPAVTKQHEHAAQSLGPAAVFSRELASIVHPKHKVFMLDAMACNATADKKKCRKPGQQALPFIAQHMRQAYQLIAAIVDEKDAVLSEVWVFGQVANSFADDIQSALPSSVLLSLGFIHPGFLRYLLSSSLIAHAFKVAIAASSTTTPEAAEKRYIELGRLSSLKRFGQKTLKEIMALDVKSLDGDSRGIGSKEAWVKDGATMTEANREAFADFYESEKPWLKTAGALAGMDLYRTLWSTKKRDGDAEETAGLGRLPIILVESGYDVDEVKDLRKLTWSKLGSVLGNTFIKTVPLLCTSYMMDCGGLYSIPAFASYLSDLHYGTEVDRDAFITENGPRYEVKCKRCGDVYESRWWLFGIPMVKLHKSGAKDCGLAYPTHEKLARIANQSGTIYRYARSILSFKEFDPEA